MVTRGFIVKPPLRQLVTLLLFFILELLVNREAFQVLPSADDYILLLQIR